MIEIISTMLILSVMASVAIKKLDFLSGTAADKVLQQGAKELNAKENLTWIDIKLSSTNWTFELSQPPSKEHLPLFVLLLLYTDF